MIKQRLQLTEQDMWDVLLKHYLTDLELAIMPMRGANSQIYADLTLDTPNDVSTFKRVAHK